MVRRKVFLKGGGSYRAPPFLLDCELITKYNVNNCKKIQLFLFIIK